jgi:hypothetical protein
MAIVAKQFVVIRKDSDGEEETFEPNTDMADAPEGELTETAILHDTETETEYVIEAGQAWGYPIPPSQITDFDATDDQVGQVTCTWSDAIGATSYNLEVDDVVEETDVTSPYVYAMLLGTKTFAIIAVNGVGETKSNTDDGTAL